MHSGDSACSLPPHSLDAATIAEIERQTRAMARALKVRGLMNVQYAIQGGDIFVLEVNPRASRTVPFVAKAIGLPVATIAARVMAGETLESFELEAAALRAHRGQGGRVAVRALPRRRCGPRPGDEFDRRGHGPRPLFAVAFAKSQIGGGSPAGREPSSSRSRMPTRRASCRLRL